MSDLHDFVRSDRRDFVQDGVDQDSLSSRPLDQFKSWLHSAVEQGVVEPYAFCLSTVGLDGFPSSRILFLRGISEEGLIFYTNYTSLKGGEIEANEGAGFNFYWHEQSRQVRVKGTLSKVSDGQSDEYFAGRPRESQLGAWASDQSSKLDSRTSLESRIAELTEQYEGKSIPRPSHWGGYILKPIGWEFWQGRESRLHDRFSYVLKDGQWQISRLYP